ncbi:MAG: TolC family protein [Campylobacterota bacterium]|nr:TolC family protein [Campylobacterota bacterium]
MKRSTLLKYFGLTALALNLNATEIYTVDELILKSLKTSPNLEISRASHKASQSRYDGAFSGYLPRVDLYASAGKAGMTDTFGGSGGMIDDNIILGKLSAKQILYDFGKTGGSVDSSRFSADSYAMQTIQDISDKKRDVKEAYYNVLNAKALIDVHQENVKLNEAQLYRSQKYFDAGIRTKIDVSDAKVSLIQAKLDLKKAEYNLKISYASLDEVVGFEELEREYSVYSKELVLKSLFESLKHYSLTLKESILYAYENRATLKKEESLIEASTAEIDEASSGYYPSLYLAADYTKQKVEKFNQFTPDNQWQATLNLDWNIYEGGLTSAKKQEKVINKSIANFTLHDSKLRIKKGTTQAYINLYKSRDSVELSQSLVQVSSEKFDQASKRYEHGLSDYIELQQARQGYIDAKAALVVDYYNYHISVAYLDNAIGR